MADPQTLLDRLDVLHGQLQDALSEKDWDALAVLNNEVRPIVEPLMEALEQGQVNPVLVRERLGDFSQFIEAAGKAAQDARSEALEALKGVNTNRKAARAYRNVSSNRQG